MNEGGLLPRRTFLRGIGALAGAACFSDPFGRNYLWAKVTGDDGEAGALAGSGAEPLNAGSTSASGTSTTGNTAVGTNVNVKV